MDSLELQIGTENDYGIIFGDIFYLQFCHINVFFYVCKTTSKQVCIYELAKKKIKRHGRTVEVLCPGLKPTQSPNIITENNCCSKSTFWVDVKDENHIWIPITSNMPFSRKSNVLFFGEKEAIKLTEEKEKGVLNYYWEV